MIACCSNTIASGPARSSRCVARPGTSVVLGLVTTKSGKVETVDELRRRIDEAARFCPLERLALSPQCGFASGIGGNALSMHAQWRKIDVIVETARKIWG
ncbi:MAG: hypothetical protein ACHQAY_04695 [Hyphomicrobiales bacterium]